MASTSSLPAAPAAASSAALDAAIADTNGSAAPASASGESASAADGDDDAAESTGVIRTVFTDPENFNVKHPLFHKWKLWFDNPSAKGLSKGVGGKDNWGETMNEVVDVDSVEEFWGLYNNIIPPSALPPKANYYLFKVGIKPAWEDPANTNGGKWSIQLPRDKSRAGIDQIWLYTMLAAIGETFEPVVPGDGDAASESNNDLITGVIMSARPQFYRIAIWTRKAEDPTEQAELNSIGGRLYEIGKHFKTHVLGYQLNQKVGGGSLTSDVEFQSHKESEKKKGQRFTV